MTGPEEVLTVREAARRLGVHENTVRNYANRGILIPRRLPSGWRRFLAADVEQLRLIIADERLALLKRSVAAITAAELDQLLVVAQMYLNVFADGVLPPAQAELYRGIEAIVGRYQPEAPA